MAGTVTNPLSHEHNLGLVRLTGSGSVDPTFGSGGQVITQIGDSTFGFAAAGQADGKILVGGATVRAGVWALALARYGADGQLDAGFGDGGVVERRRGSGTVVAARPRGASPLTAAGLRTVLAGATFVPGEAVAPNAEDIAFSIAALPGLDEVVAAASRFVVDDLPGLVEGYGYAAPGHEAVPERVMALSSLNRELAAYFFARLAPAYDVRDRLGEIAVPTLVISGRHDWVCSPAAGRALADGIPGARLVVLDDAGHFGFSESPDAFLAAVEHALVRR